MNNTMSREKFITGLICFMSCIFLTACADVAGSRDTSAVATGKNMPISVPEEVTMEFFGMNLLEANRPMWEEYVFSLNELGADDYIFTTFPIGDYEVSHSYLNFQNKNNFSSYITYGGDRAGSAQILFDENDNLLQIDICSDMGEEFSTSFLNVGDNVREYFESLKEGSWEKFLDEGKGIDKSGWYVCYSSATTPEDPHDLLQVSNDDIVLLYRIKDGVVEHIMLSVVGELTVNGGTEKSVYDLQSFDYYINGKDIAKMSAADWLVFFNFSDNDELQWMYKEKWLEILDFSDAHFKKEKPPTEAIILFADNRMWAQVGYYEDRHYKSMYLSMYSSAKEITSLNDASIYDEAVGGGVLEFSITEDGYINVGLTIEGECPAITGKYIMPGDNIKTFLNSYEDGLYEKIVSLPDPFEEYRVGPYYFTFNKNPDSAGGAIFVGKNDEKYSIPVMIDFEDEIVTRIYRQYCGAIPGFDEALSLR